MNENKDVTEYETEISIFEENKDIKDISDSYSVYNEDNLAHELNLFLAKDEYNLYHFSENVNDQKVDFDYKLKEGKLKNRNAIRILQINGYPDDLIVEAINLSKQLDRKNHTEMVG